jgi:hypothetical protein
MPDSHERTPRSTLGPFWLLLIYTENVYLILLTNLVLLGAALG